MRKPRATKKIADLGTYLDKQTGFDAAAREEWRNDIKKLGDSGRKDEALRCFGSMSFWNSEIRGKLGNK